MEFLTVNSASWLMAMGALVAGCGIGFIVGTLLCSDNVKKLEADLKLSDDLFLDAHEQIEILIDRRDRAIAALTPKAASIGRKMARILRGEE